MEVTDELIDHLAHLSRLKFNDQEKVQIKSDLENMIDFFAVLSEVDTTNVEPLLFMTDEVNVLRDDIAVDTITHEEALLNAPKKDADYFRISKVLSK
jgi:aspartyl-tRNA(Asn)/glutamyl-tRNA(Gln) amidotransferase subunit C